MMLSLEIIQSMLPSRTQLEWMSEDQVVELSRGAVTRPWGINERTGKPERSGLFCCRIFGPVDDLSCICGKYQGEPHRDVTCEKCGVDVVETAVRNRRFAHIDLPCSLAHPWSGLPTTKFPVLPPGARTIANLTRLKFTGINALYAELIKRSDLYRRCSDKAAPTVLLEHELDLLQESFDAVIGSLPKRPRRGDKLGARLRRCLSDQVPSDGLPDDLVMALHAVGIRASKTAPAD